MAKTRIYLVTDLQGNATLVDAMTPAQARGYVTRKQYAIRVATQQQLVDMLSTGAKVQRAADHEDEPSV